MALFLASSLLRGKCPSCARGGCGSGAPGKPRILFPKRRLHLASPSPCPSPPQLKSPRARHFGPSQPGALCTSEGMGYEAAEGNKEIQLIGSLPENFYCQGEILQKTNSILISPSQLFVSIIFTPVQYTVFLLSSAPSAEKFGGSVGFRAPWGAGECVN